MTTPIKGEIGGQPFSEILRNRSKNYPLGSGIYGRPIVPVFYDTAEGLMWEVRGPGITYLNGIPYLPKRGTISEGKITVKNPLCPNNYVEAEYIPSKIERK